MMAVTQLILFPVHHPHPDHPSYWFLMQLGMVLGFLTSYPLNSWLIRGKAQGGDIGTVGPQA